MRTATVVSSTCPTYTGFFSCYFFGVDSVLAFKKRNNLGRFNDAASDTSSVTSQNRGFEEAAKNIKIGDRCEVDIGAGALKRRGTVRFIGNNQYYSFHSKGYRTDSTLQMDDQLLRQRMPCLCQTYVIYRVDRVPDWNLGWRAV